ncbi:tRNA (adenosine(37)-N6)-dimethylallyltransferase MiaA [Komagataeibacter oboediens]|uniref:tRNA dimethylallyltransferase n=1 Tax=Komagataeibacter oboediens TaxID=65958 RepID=A0ABS5SKV1_9PROT|nr:tRNA (adenosine(37)-N6)-dimethylallyltransferase MiaA [Komagataeibacter oboediens]MBL7232766.1 tRNA (adenosine(37)-N6)-dimethylallyltransferase MiaA [Komagataeibacter oboediens]MBT0674485.1 tRNA (adenosine(37)-N6)-dimethylallyltransferase MiaA [Komagataeibacter oboediens]MBT0680045.1 tRNA (adenosine(37)-N6)-dimethylallyltransferase MiaA [Komagataeibacter oboediens]
MTRPPSGRARVAVIVAGPTCSGKSALALALARQVNGTIINTDSMQVYRDLRILTARPDATEEACVPHALYGVLPAAEPGSVAWWRTQAIAAAHDAWDAGRVPVFCGGTGMYFRALTDGLADIPQPPDAIRAQARDMVDRLGPEAVHDMLRQRDPETAATLRPTDGQRIARAWEVREATGHGLVWWRREAVLPPLGAHFVAIRLHPPRDALRAAIARRFHAMLDHGAVAEVARLLAQDLPPTLPAMRAHGVPELAAVLRGDMDMAAAAAQAIRLTGQYTKRQATWFAHHALAAEVDTFLYEKRFEKCDVAQQMERSSNKIISFVIKRIDAGQGFP